jgi:hypothetical protein
MEYESRKRGASRLVTPALHWQYLSAAVGLLDFLVFGFVDFSSPE